jgi:hypothetical protein
MRAIAMLMKVFPNDFWLLKDHMQEINATTTSFPLHIEVYPTSVCLFIMSPELVLEIPDSYLVG